jgi:signal transduction histidine kinase
MLDVARIAQGQLQIAKTVIDLAIVVQRAVDAIKPSVTARGQELALVLPSEPVEVEADPIRLEQAVGNLLSNASKFTGQGGHIWVTVESAPGTDESQPDAVIIRVRDDGVGIEAHLLPQVFELFTQADHSLARSQGGLGVGLTIVQRIVEAHGGQVGRGAWDRARAASSRCVSPRVLVRLARSPQRLGRPSRRHPRPSRAEC